MVVRQSVLRIATKAAACIMAYFQAKQAILQTIGELELQNPFLAPLTASSDLTAADGLQPVPELLGQWDLVFASNGTVVTRTQFAQTIAAVTARLPGVGLNDIIQTLYVDQSYPGVVCTINQADFRLGPLGTWRVSIKGSWKAAGSVQRANTAMVVFDQLAVKLCGLWGLKLPHLPEIRVPICSSRGPSTQSTSQHTSQSSMQTAQQNVQQHHPSLDPSQQHVQASKLPSVGALWVTSFLDNTWRVGRGQSGNVFLFRRRLANMEQQRVQQPL
eukprot:GHRR01015190.1.p1 GENE.GHRR01015190.1~~GHRR01015190.1.p1  ORF type:complete len:273 (+),score=67.51 GHRR01015190.1:421-1239(+)